MNHSIPALLSFSMLVGVASAQVDIIHYTFDSGDASNTAASAVGNGVPNAGVSFVNGNSCAGPGAGAAASDGTAIIDTGWTVDLGTDSWTIGMHLDLTASGNGFQYYFGSGSTGGMRCFSRGAAGTDGIMMRTLQDDVTLPGGASSVAPTHVCWVYDNVPQEVRGYVDGVLVVTVPQTAPINLVGNMPDFEVMAYFGPMLAGNLMDDFRIYRRAITQGELDAWVACGGSSFGTNFCGPAALNSTGGAASILASGSLVVSDNDVTLTATGLPNNQFGFFLNSVTQGFIPMPGGSQGNLCLAGDIGRYNGALIFNSGTNGVGSLALDLTSTPTPTGPVTVFPGQTWNFTCWYRDLNPGAASNFTDGISLSFQ